MLLSGSRKAIQWLPNLEVNVKFRGDLVSSEKSAERRHSSGYVVNVYQRSKSKSWKSTWSHSDELRKPSWYTFRLPWATAKLFVCEKIRSRRHWEIGAKLIFANLIGGHLGVVLLLGLKIIHRLMSLIADDLNEWVLVKRLLRDGNWRCGMELWARHHSANKQAQVDRRKLSTQWFAGV